MKGYYTKNDIINIVTVGLGIIVFPIGYVFESVATKVIAWLIAFACILVSLYRIHENKKIRIYWVGFMLNLSYLLIIPFIIFVLNFIRAVLHG